MGFDDFSRVRLWLDLQTGALLRRARALAEEIVRDGAREGRPTVLCLERALFRKDIDEMRRRADLGLIEVRAARVKEVQEPWVAPRFRRQTYFSNFLKTDLSAAREPLARFGQAFLEAAQRKGRISAVLAANTDYWQDEAIKLGCERLGIPFLVLCRENYVWKKSADTVHRRFVDAKFTFAGQGVAVASKVTQETMIGSGSFREQDVVVTGWPRFDCWFDRKPEARDRDSIVLVAYAEPRYLAPENFVETLHAFAEIALAHRGQTKFVVKTKKANETDEIYDLCPQLRGSSVEVTGSRSLTELYDRARLVIGYNSLAVLEALLSEPAVAVPWWRDAVRPQTECLLSADSNVDRDVVQFANTPTELKALMEAAAAGTLQPRGSKSERLGRFSSLSSFDPRKSSSQRVAEWIHDKTRLK